MARQAIKVVKKLDNGSALFNDGTCRTPIARAVFVNLVTAKENESEDGTKRLSYGFAMLFKPKEDLRILKLCTDNFAKAEKGEKNAAKYAKRTWRLQDDKVDQYDGFVKGGYYMNVSSKFQPTATSAGKGDIELGAFYSGCYVRAVLRPYIFDRLGNRGVALGLSSVQFIKDGERLGSGGVDPDSVFDDEDDGSSDDMDGMDDDDGGLL